MTSDIDWYAILDGLDEVTPLLAPTPEQRDALEEVCSELGIRAIWCLHDGYGTELPIVVTYVDARRDLRRDVLVSAEVAKVLGRKVRLYGEDAFYPIYIAAGGPC